ncbi:MAG: hypothetical protein WC773_00790 [Patescibacteria group bacterium]
MANVQDLMEKDIFELLHIPDLPDDKKTEMLNIINETIQARVVARIAEAVSEEEAQQFSALAEKDDQEAMKKFLTDRQISLEQLALEEALNYRIELVETLDLATNSKES